MYHFLYQRDESARGRGYHFSRFENVEQFKTEDIQKCVDAWNKHLPDVIELKKDKDDRSSMYISRGDDYVYLIDGNDEIEVRGGNLYKIERIKLPMPELSIKK